MRKSKVSNNVIRRLPRYLRKLDELTQAGVERISSSELGKQMLLTPSQIRQDFNCFGEFGQQGYGYNIAVLRDEISKILGMKSGLTAIIVGAGNLGRALMRNFEFSALGFRLDAAFDTDPALIGESVNGVEILDAGTLAAFLRENPVDIAVLTVPRAVADKAASGLAGYGVRAIWNFTNQELDIGDSIIVENIHFSDGLLALGYRLSEKGGKPA